jgi:hypothetical protein
MSQNNITVTLGELRTDRVCGSLALQPRQEIDIGRLPPGIYTLTTLVAPISGNASEILINKAPFAIAD